MPEELSQAKVYLQPGQKAPKGVAVQKGKKGGSWYESTGREASPKSIGTSKNPQAKNIQRMKGKQLPDAWKGGGRYQPLSPDNLSWLKSLGVSKYPPPKNTLEGSIQIHKNADPDRQALMTWRDLNGKVQHSYSKVFHQNNALVKWKSVEKFRPQVEKLRASLKSDVQKAKLGTPEHQVSMISAIIAETGLRPGNELSASHGHYGVSTLRTNHVKFDGAREARLEFIGKSGMLNKKTITDPVLVGGLKELTDKAQKDGRKNIFTIDVANVRSILPKGMKLKTFRTIIATEEAERFLAGKDVKLTGNKAKDKKIVAGALKEASSHVASQLNNTPAVARSSYIHPNVFNDWLHKIGGAGLAQ